MWLSRLNFDLEDGQQVVCRGDIDVYLPRGSYQLIVRQIEPRGVGTLQQRLRQLQQKLAAAGLFDAAHKQPLPVFPRRLAVVTSPTGAAIRDFLEVVRHRSQSVEVMIVPSRVQGDGAAEEIARAIALVNRLEPAPDVLVVTRGGGSMEDLWCFNEEAVVRAIFDSRIPVVSAIGHEIDVTLADLVADWRSLTPTEAAQRVVPSTEEIAASLAHFRSRLQSSLAAVAGTAPRGSMRSLNAGFFRNRWIRSGNGNGNWMNGTREPLELLSRHCARHGSRRRLAPISLSRSVRWRCWLVAIV